MNLPLKIDTKLIWGYFQELQISFIPIIGFVLPVKTVSLSYGNRLH